MNKNTKIIHYKPVLWVEINDILGKYKFDSLRTLLDSGNIFYIPLGKHT